MPRSTCQFRPPTSTSTPLLRGSLGLAVCLALLICGLVASPSAADDEKKPEGLPLESHPELLRDFEVTVDQVTWLSVDLSPDGKTIVLEVLGRLFVMPFEGGAATPLSTLPESMGFDAQPAFSPDGRWIAFVSDRDGGENLWIAPFCPDGCEEEPKQLTKEQQAAFLSPTWSADGDYVIVSKDGGAGGVELWMYHVRGGSGIQVTKSDPTGSTPRRQRLSHFGAAASTDGRFLYYAQRTGGFQYNANFPMWQIVRRDLDSGDTDTITHARGSAMRPTLSPDGKQLVYATRHDQDTGLRLRELASGEERWIAYPVQRDEQESRGTRDNYPGYSFTPDGRSIVTTWDGRLYVVPLDGSDPREIPFEVTVRRKIGPSLHTQQKIDDGPFKARLAQASVVSQATERVAFSTLGQIHVAELALGAEEAPRPIGITRGDLEAYQPAFSPDGRRLAFVTWSRDGGHIWTIAITGGTPSRLTQTPAFYSRPVWSPDGSRIVALRGARQARVEMQSEFGGNSRPLDLVWVDASARTPGETNLIAPARGTGRPHFGPEEDRIYVHSQQGLQSMRFDGTDRKSHLQVVAAGRPPFAPEPTPAREILLSPDGGWALADAGNRFYLVAVPRRGGEPPKVDVGNPSVPTRVISRLGADSFSWSADGATVYWGLGSTLFATERADISFDPPKPTDDSDGDAAEAAESETAKLFPDARSQDLGVQIERYLPRGTVALQGARVVTMTDEDGGVVDDATVLVVDNRIAEIGPRTEVTVPDDARVFDVAGKTIVPGFIDTHAHWTEIRRGVLDTDAWTFRANLAYGVTTGLDVQTMTNDMFAYQDFLDAGRIVGPRAFSTGPGVFGNNDFKSYDEALALLERYRDHWGTRNLKAYLSGNRKQRQWVVRAASELGMIPTTEGALDLKLDVTHAIDGFAGNEHSLPVVPVFDDVSFIHRDAGTAYTPTLLVAYGGPWAENWFYTKEVVHDDEKLRRFVPHDILDGVTRMRPWFRDSEHVFQRLAASAAKMLRDGARVGVGAHGQLQGLGYHWELWAVASGGMTNVEALRAATVIGAEIIGLELEVGSLEAGKLADLVVLNGNPLEDLRATADAALVMKGGQLFDASTLDELWPVEREAPAPWWSGVDPAPRAP